MNSAMTQRLAMLCSRDPFYLGWHLSRYAEISGGVARVAAELGCLPEVINEMSLSKSPRPDPPRFRHDVEAIAQRFQVRADALANIVRTANIATASEPPAILAARDRGPDDEYHPEQEPT